MQRSPDQAVAPARRRFRLFHVFLVIGAVFLFVLALLAFPVLRIATAVPGTNPNGAASMTALVHKYQPDTAETLAPNAWPIFQDAIIEAHDVLSAIDTTFDDALDDEVEALFGDLNPSVANWFDPLVDPEDYHPSEPLFEHVEEINSLARDIVGRAADGLEAGTLAEALDALVAAEHAVRPVPQGQAIHAILLPELGTARRTARLLQVRLRRAAEAGDDATVVRSCERILMFGRILSHQFSLIDRLVGIAIDALACWELRRFVAGADRSPETLAALLAVWQRQAGRPPPVYHIETERLASLDIIERTHSDDAAGYALPVELGWIGGGFGAQGGAASTSPSILNVPGLLLPRKAQTLDAVNGFYDTLAAMAEVPYASRDHGRANRELESIDNTLVQLILPALGSAISSVDAAACGEAGVHLLLAIELHRARTGAPPAVLADLVPGVLDAIPSDPMAPDGRFRYELGPEHRGGYVLYSVGRDARDDGGNHAENALNSADATGVDFAFSTPPSDD